MPRHSQNSGLRKLPPKMHFKHGRHYYVHAGKWHPLSRDYKESLQQYTALVSDPMAGGMAELLDSWYAMASTKLKPSTKTHYKSAIESKIKPAFVEFHPSQVTAGIVMQFLEHHASTPNMSNRMRTILKMAFNRAVLLGLATVNPVTSVPRFKEAKRGRYMSDEEFHAIRGKATPELQRIMDIAYFTGQRIGDVLKIHLADLKDDGVLIEQQKTGAKVTIGWTPELKRAIDAAKASGGPVRGLYLFGARLSYYTVRDWYKAAAKAAGVSDTRLHDLRAKSITEANRQGLDAQKLAGHSDPRMTERYIRDREIPIATPPTMNKKMGQA